MQLTPRYGNQPVLRLESVIDDPVAPMVRQRARLADTLARLDDEQWSAPSRCDGWSVQDVVTHLVSTNQFWTFSISAGRRGTPTEFLADFDPVATPAQLVDGLRSWTAAETLDRFVETSDDLAAAVADLDESTWSMLAEAPPGHLALGLVVLHALWDAWIHERDVLLPLGITTVEEADELTGCLIYAAGLGPALAAGAGATREGALELDASEPDIHLVVELGPTVLVHDRPAPSGAVRLTGDALTLIEALSFRAPLEHPLAEDDQWVLGGLARAFDVIDGDH